MKARKKVAQLAVALTLIFGAVTLNGSPASACPAWGECWTRINSTFAVTPWGSRMGPGTGFTGQTRVWWGAYGVPNDYVYSPYNPVGGWLPVGPSNAAYRSYSFCYNMFAGVTWAPYFSACTAWGGTPGGPSGASLGASYDEFQWVATGGFWYLDVRSTITDRIDIIAPPPPPPAGGGGGGGGAPPPPAGGGGCCAPPPPPVVTTTTTAPIPPMPTTSLAPVRPT